MFITPQQVDPGLNSPELSYITQVIPDYGQDALSLPESQTQSQ